MNPHVPITQIQQSSFHGQVSFHLYSPHLLYFEANSKCPIMCDCFSMYL